MLIPDSRILLKDLDKVTCVACGTPGEDDANDLLFCGTGRAGAGPLEGCNTATCQRCAGLAAVPEGDWFCGGCSDARAAACATAGFGSDVWKGYERRVLSLALQINRHR